MSKERITLGKITDSIVSTSKGAKVTHRDPGSSKPPKPPKKGADITGQTLAIGKGARASRWNR